MFADGVLKAEVALERELSLLRERFDDEGEAGTASGVDDMFCVSVWTPPLTLALRLSARSFCSLNVVLVAMSAAVGEESGGGRATRGTGDGMVVVLGRIRARRSGVRRVG